MARDEKLIQLKAAVLTTHAAYKKAVVLLAQYKKEQERTAKLAKIAKLKAMKAKLRKPKAASPSKTKAIKKPLREKRT